MREIREYTSEKYGNFSIEQYENHRDENRVCIWWDFYDEQDGVIMGEGGADWFYFKDCDVTDFSDIPRNGLFYSFKEAKDYLILKFGEIY
jgi:hypothetical protein